MTDTVPLPPCDPAQCIPYQSIRYINGYAESYVHQFARDYAAAVSAADNAALRAENAAINQAADVVEAAYRKRVEELEAASQWRPIETAPKDGRKMLLTYKNRNGKRRTVVGGWVTDEEAAETDTDGVGLEAGWYERIDNWDDYYQVAIHEGEPDHWKPLPSQPKEPKHG